MVLTTRLRKVVLAAHVTSSVGWLGAVAAFGALALAGLTSQDPVLVRSAYVAMNLTGWFVREGAYTLAFMGMLGAVDPDSAQRTNFLNMAIARAVDVVYRRQDTYGRWLENTSPSNGQYVTSSAGGSNYVAAAQPFINALVMHALILIHRAMRKAGRTGGADAANYTLIQPSATANITARTLSVTATAVNKVYDATTSATLDTATASLVGVISGDTVSLNSASASFIVPLRAVLRLEKIGAPCACTRRTSRPQRATSATPSSTGLSISITAAMRS